MNQAFYLAHLGLCHQPVILKMDQVSMNLFTVPAPDIAGQGIANPISMILSVAMMLRDSFGRYEDAERVERAVEASLAAGVLTRDIGGQASTKEMTEAIIARL